MPVTFEAKFNGTCAAPDCWYGDNHIRPGDSVGYNASDELCHAGCMNRTTAPLCKSCNMFHRGECG